MMQASCFRNGFFRNGFFDDGYGGFRVQTPTHEPRGRRTRCGQEGWSVGADKTVSRPILSLL